MRGRSLPPALRSLHPLAFSFSPHTSFSPSTQMPALLRGQALRFPATAPAARCVCEGGGAGRNWRAPHASLLAHAQKKKNSHASLSFSLSPFNHTAPAPPSPAPSFARPPLRVSPQRGGQRVFESSGAEKKCKGAPLPRSTAHGRRGHAPPPTSPSPALSSSPPPFTQPPPASPATPTLPSCRPATCSPKSRAAAGRTRRPARTPRSSPLASATRPSPSRPPSPRPWPTRRRAWARWTGTAGECGGEAGGEG